MIKTILTTMIMLAFVAGCSNSNEPPEKVVQDLPPVGLTAKELHESLGRQQGMQLIDVRTLPEWKGGHIHGARHIPLHELEGKLNTLEKNRPVIAYCASGNRSGRALEMLKAHGFKMAGHLAGGITAWREAKFEVEK